MKFTLFRLRYHPWMRLPLYQVDAFASSVFSGNPAAVVPCERALDDAAFKRYAQEIGLEAGRRQISGFAERAGRRRNETRPVGGWLDGAWLA